MRSEIFSAQYLAQPATQVGIEQQNSHCVKAVINGEVLARQGALVAYRGNLTIDVKGQGVGGFLKRAFTGEGLSLMAVRGQGEAWFADRGEHCFLLDLEPSDSFSVDGRHVLCFDAGLQYDIQRISGAGMSGGGLFNSVFTGVGRIAVISDGTPVAIPVTAQLPVFVDTDAVIGWTSGLSTQIRRSAGLKSMLRGGSGEMFQLGFSGEGVVLVQPSEGTPVTTGNSGGGGAIDSLFS